MSYSRQDSNEQPRLVDPAKIMDPSKRMVESPRLVPETSRSVEGSLQKTETPPNALLQNQAQSFDRRHGSMKGSYHGSMRGHHPDLYNWQAGQMAQPGYRQEGYSRDDYLVGLNSPEVAAGRYDQNIPDVSQITAVQVTPRPKPRAFPRTNPSYVGVQRRDGHHAYKKINIDEHLLPGLAIEQKFFNDTPKSGSRSQQQTQGIQATPIYSNADVGIRHDRSDSDISHSSYGRIRNEMTDSQISRVSQGSTAVVTKLPREHSDSQSSKSSQCSLKNLQNSNSHSSQGSLGGRSSDKELYLDVSQDRQDTNSVSSVGSGRSSVNKQRNDHSTDIMDTLHEHTGSIDSGVEKTLQRRNSEPDYANLPVIAHIEGGKIMTIESHLPKGHKKNLAAYSEDERLHDDFRSGDSLSPHDYSNRQDTPSSVRSMANSSHTSEGIHLQNKTSFK